MSEEKSKGISLRTKRQGRPTISSPTLISAPIQTRDTTQSNGKQSFETPAPQRPLAGGKTSDLVKRRYSTRFNNLPADFDPTRPPVPALPSLPPQFAPKDRDRDLAPRKNVKLNIDVVALQDPNLKPEQYVAGLFGDASEQNIDEYYMSLRNLRNGASTDLQQNVLQNRTQFIKISKEAEKLKGEMRALKNLMSDLKTNTMALRAASSQASTMSDFERFPAGMSKMDKRSSVADRSLMWSSQLQALWRMVEDSQKFLPAAPGRRPIQDAGVWIELDNATWKPRCAMQIILLNDHLLIAVRRKQKVEGSGTDQPLAITKIVADRCWPLLDIEMVDLSGTNESAARKTRVADAIMIRGVGHETFTYRAEKLDGVEKQSLLMNFKKQVEELRKIFRSEMETSNKAKEAINYFASRDPGLLKKTDLLKTLSDTKDMLIEVDGKQRNLRWVESQVDELDIDIALQRFDAAVLRVEQLQSIAKNLKGNIVAKDFISFKADKRAMELAGLITRQLVDTHNEPKKVMHNVNWLARLGFEDRAREVYLEARSNIIHRRSRQCIFEGNLHQYIWEVSLIYFTFIRNTVSTFQTSFPSLLMSACVKWARDQVEKFNQVLERQLSSTERGGPVWTECMNQALEHANTLAEIGLDFRGLVAREGDQGLGRICNL